MRIHLVRKTKTMKIQHPGWRPLIAVLNKAIHFAMLTLLKPRRRHVEEEITFTDYDSLQIINDGEAWAAPSEPDQRELADVAQELVIHLIDYRDDMIGGLDNDQDLSLLFDAMLDRIIKLQPLPTYDEIDIPVAPEHYAIVAARVRRAAQSLSRGQEQVGPQPPKATV